MDDNQFRALIAQYAGLSVFKNVLPRQVADNRRVEDDVEIMAHLRYMLDKMPEFIGHPEEQGKLNRWLGFFQGVIWSRGIKTLGKLRGDIRPKGKKGKAPEKVCFCAKCELEDVQHGRERVVAFAAEFIREVEGETYTACPQCNSEDVFDDPELQCGNCGGSPAEAEAEHCKEGDWCYHCAPRNKGPYSIGLDEGFDEDEYARRVARMRLPKWYRKNPRQITWAAGKRLVP